MLTSKISYGSYWNNLWLLASSFSFQTANNRKMMLLPAQNIESSQKTKEITTYASNHST
jgi:hypothetical protein